VRKVSCIALSRSGICSKCDQSGRLLLLWSFASVVPIMLLLALLAISRRRSDIRELASGCERMRRKTFGGMIAVLLTPAKLSWIMTSAIVAGSMPVFPVLFDTPLCQAGRQYNPRKVGAVSFVR
jgi:hypothetical protein